MSAAAVLDPATFAAFGEPNRLRIVELLRAGPQSVGAMVEHLGLRQPQVSKHLRVLAESGIVECEVRHRHRIYHLRPERFDAVAEWVNSFDHLWEMRLDALGGLLQVIEPKGPTGHEQAQ